MGKISPVSTKYIIHAQIEAEGIVTKPDVIGAVFGQTEGLLGEGLELRDLQKSGKIGRIDVELKTKLGKTSGEIFFPSSLDKSETAIIAAALETIQRIGPCNAKIAVTSIEDVRVLKRDYVLERAKGLLKNMIEKVMPDSQEITEEVRKSVRALEIGEYGPERLPSGPGIEDSEEIILVEGRADVLNLLKNGFRNVMALGGTGIPEAIVDLSKTKTIIAFVDGDRGGDLIVQELVSVAEIDFVARAPDGKEVEELTKKEIHKSLRGMLPVEQWKRNGKMAIKKKERVKLSKTKAATFKKMLKELKGTRGAYILGKKMEILGKVPLKELRKTLNELAGIYAVVMDGMVTPDIARVATAKSIEYLVAIRRGRSYRNLNILFERDLG